MSKSDFLVIGDWAIHRRDGFVRHLICRRNCDFFNARPSDPFHNCQGKNVGEEDDWIQIKIPPFVVEVATCLRRK